MKKILLVCSSILLILSGCTGSKKEKVISIELQPISLGVMSSMDYVPFIIAEKEGIYDSLGLKVNIVKFFSTTDRDAAFQSGDIDGTIIDYTNAAILQSHHTPLKIIMKNDGYFCFIAGKESGIKSLSQLKGKNIAVSHNSVIDYVTDFILNKAGITLAEVNKPEINNIPLRLEMLQYGQVDASVFSDPFATIAMNNGHKSLISTQELGLSITGTIFSEKVLKNKSEEIKRLVKGYNLAVDYIHAHPLKEWKQILIEDAGVPEALAGIIALPQYQYAALPAAKDLEGTIAWLKAKNLLPNTYSIKNIVDSIYTQPDVATETE